MTIQTNGTGVQFEKNALIEVLSEISDAAVASLQTTGSNIISSTTLESQGYTVNLDLFNMVCLVGLPHTLKPITELGNANRKILTTNTATTELNGYINLYSRVAYTHDAQIPIDTGLSTLTNIQYDTTVFRMGAQAHPSPMIDFWHIIQDAPAQRGRWIVGDIPNYTLPGDIRINNFKGIGYIQNDLSLPFIDKSTQYVTEFTLPEDAEVEILLNNNTFFLKPLESGKYTFTHTGLTSGINQIKTIIRAEKNTTTNEEIVVFHQDLLTPGEFTLSTYLGYATAALNQQTTNTFTGAGHIQIGVDKARTLGLHILGYKNGNDIGSSLHQILPVGLGTLTIGQTTEKEASHTYIGLGAESLQTSFTRNTWVGNIVYRTIKTAEYPEIETTLGFSQEIAPVSLSVSGVYSRYTNKHNLGLRISALFNQIETNPRFTLMLQDPRVTQENIRWELSFNIPGETKSSIRQTSAPETFYTNDYQIEATSIGTDLRYESPQTFRMSTKVRYEQTDASLSIGQTNAIAQHQLFFRHQDPYYEFSGNAAAQDKSGLGFANIGTAFVFVGDSWGISRPIRNNFVMFVAKNRNQPNNTLIIGNNHNISLAMPYIVPELSTYQNTHISWTLLDKHSAPFLSDILRTPLGFESGKKIIIDGAQMTTVAITFQHKSHKPIELARGTLEAGNDKLDFFTNKSGQTYIYGAKAGVQYTLVLPGFHLENPHINIPENVDDIYQMGTIYAELLQ